MPKPGEWLKGAVKASSTARKETAVEARTAVNSQVEEWIRKFNVSYSRLLDLPLSQVDVRSSRSNQARPAPVVAESVDRFVLALKAGDDLPPIVCYSNGGKVVIIDGNNRDESYRKAGRATIPAFVVAPDTPSEIILLMTVDANSHHGVTPPLAWRLVQADHLVELGLTNEAAAAAAAVTARQVMDHRRVIGAEARAKALKLSGFPDLPVNVKLRLAALKADPVFLSASRVVVETGMTYRDATDFTRQIQAHAGGEQNQMKFILEVAEDRKMEARRLAALGKVPMRNPRQGLITGLGKVQHADINAVVKSTTTNVERSELSNRCLKMAERLMEIAEALDQAARVGES